MSIDATGDDEVFDQETAERFAVVIAVPFWFARTVQDHSGFWGVIATPMDRVWFRREFLLNGTYVNLVIFARVLKHFGINFVVR